MNAELGKLLVVDDNEMNRDMLSRRLARKGHDVLTAHDGAAALDMVGREAFDMVLLDIEMPGIDGFEVLERIRASSSPSDLPVVMATARHDSADIVRALKEGANDYVTKPLDFAVVLARVQAQLSLKRSREALTAAHARMKRDLEAAAMVQQALMPSEPPSVDGYRFAWVYRPCDELAGDSLNVFRIDDRYVGLYVLDVSGHGVPAAMLSVTATHRLGRHGDRAAETAGDAPVDGITSPARLVTSLNTLYQMRDNGNRYFTIVYGILDTQESRFRFVTAGHPGPILLRRNEAPRIVDVPALAVGWVDTVEYEDTIIDLEPGDRLFLHSDGLNEEQKNGEEEFGRKRLGSSLDRRADVSLPESLDGLVDDVIAWRGDDKFQDDISIVAVEFSGPSS
jgi:sigma-B regulation protein RsbU (phosphoserine phosphatase)